MPGMIQQVMDGAAHGTRLVVVGVCLVPDQIVPVTAITKQLNVQFAIGYTAAEFAQSLGHLADGRIDASAWITGKAGLDDALTAFADLKHPEHHVKILIEPWR
jgi:threonine dehydrogenase-like Zn-dependent dehydrogenase